MWWSFCNETKLSNTSIHADDPTMVSNTFATKPRSAEREIMIIARILHFISNFSVESAARFADFSCSHSRNADRLLLGPPSSHVSRMLQKQLPATWRGWGTTRCESEEKSTRSRNASLHRVAYVGCLTHAEWWSSGFILGIVRISNFSVRFFSLLLANVQNFFCQHKIFPSQNFVFGRFHSDSHSANIFCVCQLRLNNVPVISNLSNVYFFKCWRDFFSSR